MIEETFERARRPEQKLQRRDAILGAARDLALRDGVRNVSLADIAARVSIHKSALLRYFETREQIFLELTAEAWRDWVAALRSGLDAAETDSSGKNAAGRVADVLARSFADRPLLCDLIAHTPLNLERNVSPAAVRSYKLTSLGAVNEAATLVRHALPDLTVAECTELISALASLAGAVWQIANPAPALAELYASDPALAQACVDLAPRLRRTAQILLAGLIPSRSAESLGSTDSQQNDIRDPDHEPGCSLVTAASSPGRCARTAPAPRIHSSSPRSGSSRYPLATSAPRILRLASKITL